MENKQHHFSGSTVNEDMMISEAEVQMDAQT